MKKFLSVLLSMAMLVTLLPAMSAFAVEYDNTAVTFEAADVTAEAGDEITVELKFKSGFRYMKNSSYAIDWNSDYLEYVGTAVLSSKWFKVSEVLQVGATSKDERFNKSTLFAVEITDMSATESPAFDIGETFLNVKFKVKEGISTYVETPVGFSCFDAYAVFDNKIEDLVNIFDIEGKLTLPTAMVKIGTKPTTVEKKLTNFVTANGDINANIKTYGQAAWRMIPVTVEGQYDLSPKSYDTAEDAKAKITAADEYWKAKGYGDKASFGAVGWSDYPKVNGTSVDSPMAFTTANTSAEILNGETYVIKKGKGDYFTASGETITDKGILGDNPEYIKFDTPASGTMYVRPAGVGSYPGGEAAGYKKTSLKIGGSDVWAKHFDVAEDADKVTVAVPAMGLSDTEIWKVAVSSTDKRVRDGVSYYWVYDDASVAELNGVSYKIGGMEGETAFVSGTDTYTVNTFDYTGSVDLVFDKKAGKQTVTPTSVDLTNGNGTVEVTATSVDGSATKTYTINFVNSPYKVINATKVQGAAWVTDGSYASTDTSKSYYAVTDGLEVGTSKFYSDRTSVVSKAGTTANLAGATYVRTPKNEGISTYQDIEVFDSEGKSGGAIEFTKTVGEGDAAVDTTLTGRVDGALDGVKFTTPDTKENHSGFRYVAPGKGSKDQAFFNGKFDGTDGKWWATFVPTSDCTVILADNVGGGYPNLDKDLWKNNTVYGYNSGPAKSYARHFEAGQTVEIPNYGLFGKMLDDRKVTYKYYDKNGTLQTKETTEGAACINFDDIGIAIIWDAKSIESSAATIKVDGKEISGFKPETTSYSYVVPYGTESVNLEVVAGDANTATVSGVAASYKAGDTATVTVTAGDGTTKTVYTIAFTAGEAPKSSNANLSSISVNGKAIEGFAADKTAYSVVLENGVEVSSVTGEAADDKATVEVTNAANVYTIKVTAEDGTVKTYTVTVTNKEKPYELNVSAIGGGKITATYADKVDEDWAQSKTTSIDVGTQITLKAVAEDGEEFLYWKDVDTSRVVSYNPEYTFDIGTGKALVAMFKTSGSYNVKFMDMNNKVVSESESAVEITVPQNPYLLGYTFGGWKIGDAVKSEYVAGYKIPANTFDADTVITAVQTKDATTYNVTFENVKDLTSGAYQYDTKLTVKHIDAPEGQKFYNWERDGKVVSYDDEYTFFVGNYDTTIKAVFVTDSTAVAAKPTIAMAEPTIVAGNKISFMMERTAPEGFTVVEAGILMKKDAQTSIKLGDAGVIKGTSVNHASYGAYNLRKANVSKGDTWSAVGYLIYKDADNNVFTIYTDVVSKTLE